MKVSVIIPHYNAEKFIAEAVESVVLQGEIVQELIVIDDGSDESSDDPKDSRWFAAMEACIEPLKKAHESLSELWFRNSENRGQGAALNLGLLSAHAPFAAFLDADDVWTEGKLETQVKILEESGADAVYGSARQFIERADGVVALHPKVSAPLLSGLCVRRHVLDDVPFGEGLGAGMTIDWFARARDHGVKFAVSDLVFFHRRIHDDNYGVRHRERARDEYVRAIRQIEERRRRAKAEPSVT